MAKDEEVKKEEGGSEIQTIEKCACCINYRPEQHGCRGKCMVNKDDAGNFVEVEGENNYCSKFEQMPEDKEED